MIAKNIINIIISLSVLLLIVLISLKCCNSNSKKYTQQYVDELLNKYAANKQEYDDSLAFVRSQLNLQESKDISQTEKIILLERNIDSLLKKHIVTKNKIKFDTSFSMWVPNEYVDECETCFNKLRTYKDENIQLRFERDSYDTLMRQQSDLQADRIERLEHEKSILLSAWNSPTMQTCDTTRKLKFSIAGQLNDLFLPRAGGFGLIYEDKKFNEFGAHVLFSGKGNIYILNIAKTISIKRKK